MSKPQTATSPKRILHVQNGTDIYGSSRMLLRWLKNLDRRRFDPLVVLPGEGPLKNLIEAEGIEVILHPAAEHYLPPGIPLLENHTIFSELSGLGVLFMAAHPTGKSCSGLYQHGSDNLALSGSAAGGSAARLSHPGILSRISQRLAAVFPIYHKIFSAGDSGLQCHCQTI